MAAANPVIEKVSLGVFSTNIGPLLFIEKWVLLKKVEKLMKLK
ncbi:MULTISPECIES: hypothetical protein [unclassified Lysinibacillus]